MAEQAGTATVAGGEATAQTQTAPADRKLTDAERAHLIAEVRLSFHYQRTFWEVLRTGTALGAEEVQDQRLAAAETPPEANPALDVFLFLIMWSVEGPLASTILAVAQQHVVAGLQRQMRLQATAYRQLIESEVQAATSALREARRIAAERASSAARASGILRRAEGRTSASRIDRIQDAVRRSEAAQQELQQVLGARANPGAWSSRVSDQRAGLQQTAAALRGIRQGDLPEYITAVGNIALQQPIRFAEAERAERAPGVGLRATVEKQALAVIQESYLLQECYELRLVQDTTLTAGHAATAYEDIGAAAPVDVATLIDRYQLLTAALIWAKLLDLGALRANRSAEQDARRRTTQTFAGDPVPPGYRGPTRLMTVPEVHRRYLIGRFAAAAEAWARQRPADVLLPDGRGDRPTTPAEVEQYIAAGQAQPGRGVQRFLGLAPDPDLWRLDLVVQWLSALAEQAPGSILR